jgi:hypothetical protein
MPLAGLRHHGPTRRPSTQRRAVRHRMTDLRTQAGARRGASRNAADDA